MKLDFVIFSCYKESSKMIVLSYELILLIQLYFKNHSGKNMYAKI